MKDKIITGPFLVIDIDRCHRMTRNPNEPYRCPNFQLGWVNDISTSKVGHAYSSTDLSFYLLDSGAVYAPYFKTLFPFDLLLPLVHINSSLIFMKVSSESGTGSWSNSPNIWYASNLVRASKGFSLWYNIHASPPKASRKFPKYSFLDVIIFNHKSKNEMLWNRNDGRNIFRVANVKLFKLSIYLPPIFFDLLNTRSRSPLFKESRWGASLQNCHTVKN